MIETDSVEGVLKSETTLDFVSHDHSGENVLDGEVGESGSSHPVGDGEDSTGAIGGVTPFGSCNVKSTSVSPSSSLRSTMRTEETYHRSERQWYSRQSEGERTIVEIQPSNLSSNSKGTSTERTASA